VNVTNLAGALAVTAALAQPLPKFDVASIKRNVTGARRVSIGGISPARFSAENVWLGFLIQWAWNVRAYQISGGPGWAASERYDISATKDPNSGLDQTRLMVQALLQDRFQLKLHRETRESQAYVLLPGKGEPKLHPAKEGACVPKDSAGDSDPRKVCGFLSFSPSSVDGTAIPIERLATALSQALQRPVIDKTGLTGAFDVHAEWIADQSTPGLLAPGMPLPASQPPDSSGSSIFTALQQQLGLKLESTKGPVEFLVIDRLERPSEN
jgi:uncharacterized protein (TIGR03435 family)